MIVPPIELLLLTRVTGIPPTEKRALASRGDDYCRYQATTSPFIPGFLGLKRPAKGVSHECCGCLAELVGFLMV